MLCPAPAFDGWTAGIKQKYKTGTANFPAMHSQSVFNAQRGDHFSLSGHALARVFWRGQVDCSFQIGLVFVFRLLGQAFSLKSDRQTIGIRRVVAVRITVAVDIAGVSAIATRDGGQPKVLCFNNQPFA